MSTKNRVFFMKHQTRLEGSNMIFYFRFEGFKGGVENCRQSSRFKHLLRYFANVND